MIEYDKSSIITYIKYIHEQIEILDIKKSKIFNEYFRHNFERIDSLILNTELNQEEIKNEINYITNLINDSLLDEKIFNNIKSEIRLKKIKKFFNNEGL